MEWKKGLLTGIGVAVGVGIGVAIGVGGCQLPQQLLHRGTPAQLQLPVGSSCLLSLESGEELLLKEANISIPLAERMKPLLLMEVKGLGGGSTTGFQVRNYLFRFQLEEGRCYLLLDLPDRRNPFSAPLRTPINCSCQPIPPKK